MNKPETKDELIELISNSIEMGGNLVDLNFIDISLIEDMSSLFLTCPYYQGDISNWNVSHVKNMRRMFFNTPIFESDISKWDVSNVKDFSGMFYHCHCFRGNIYNWKISLNANIDNIFDETMPYFIQLCPKRRIK